MKNEKRIQQRSRWARIILPIGLAALIVGFVLSLNTGNAQAQIGAWVALIIGVACASIGIYLADKWLSLPNRPRGDVTLEGTLKSLDVRHKLYSFAVPPAEQVMLSPAGLTVFLIKKQDGTIECKDGKWRNKISIFQWLGSFSRERLGNPPRELEAAIGRVKTVAQQATPDADVPVDGLIVLSSPRALIKIDGCDESLIAVPDELRAKFRELNGGARRISDTTYRQLETALDALAGEEVTETSTTRTTRPVAGTTSTATTRSPSAGRSRFTRPTRKATPKGDGASTASKTKE